jgi:hypothetical protein
MVCGLSGPQRPLLRRHPIVSFAAPFSSSQDRAEQQRPRTPPPGSASATARPSCARSRFSTSSLCVGQVVQVSVPGSGSSPSIPSPPRRTKVQAEDHLGDMGCSACGCRILPGPSVATLHRRGGGFGGQGWCRWRYGSLCGGYITAVRGTVPFLPLVCIGSRIDPGASHPG